MHTYNIDTLGNGFEQCPISLNDDYEGKALATIIRRKSEHEVNRAVLYIHGFNDYFFQKEMAMQFNNHGLNFYAIDLRKYGRSHLPHQKLNDIKDLKSYYEEIIKTIEIIKKEGNLKIILMGHSTGGLILTLFAKDHSGSNLFNGLIINSPFYDFNLPPVTKFLIPAISLLGRFFSSVKVNGGFTEEYGKSIHKNYYGEWDYNLNWKPNIPPPINLGWLRAIYKGQMELNSPFYIKQPVLLMHSDHSVTDEKDRQQMLSSDAILNVKDINRIAQNIIGNIEIKPIKDGLHDLILSPTKVRENAYSAIFNWIDRLF